VQRLYTAWRTDELVNGVLKRVSTEVEIMSVHSVVLPLLVTSDVELTRCGQRESTVDKPVTRPAPVGVLGECDEPPRPLPKGRMKQMIHQAVVDSRLPTV